MEKQYFLIKKFIALLSCLSVRESSNVSLGRWCLLIRGDKDPTLCSHLEIRAILILKGQSFIQLAQHETLCRKSILLCVTCNLSFQFFIKNAPISPNPKKLALLLKTVPHPNGDSQLHSHNKSQGASLGTFQVWRNCFWVRIKAIMRSQGSVDCGNIF